MFEVCNAFSCLQSIFKFKIRASFSTSTAKVSHRARLLKACRLQPGVQCRSGAAVQQVQPCLLYIRTVCRIFTCMQTQASLSARCTTPPPPPPCPSTAKSSCRRRSRAALKRVRPLKSVRKKRQYFRQLSFQHSSTLPSGSRHAFA